MRAVPALNLSGGMIDLAKLTLVHSWSAYNAWQEDHPEMIRRDAGGEGDVIDEMFEEMRSGEPSWLVDDGWLEKEVHIEWGSGLVLARKR